MMYCIHIIIYNSNYIYQNFHVFNVLLTFKILVGGRGGGNEGMQGRGEKMGNLQYPENFFSRRIAIWLVPSFSLRVIFRFDNIFYRSCFFFIVQQHHRTHQLTGVFLFWICFFFFLLTTLGKSPFWYNKLARVLFLCWSLKS